MGKRWKQKWGAAPVIECGALFSNCRQISIKLHFASIVPHTPIGCGLITSGGFNYRDTQGWYFLQGSKKYYQNFFSKKFDNNNKNNYLMRVNNKSTGLSLFQSIPGAKKKSSLCFVNP